MAAAAKGFDRATADYMGMLATVMNALASDLNMSNLHAHRATEGGSES